MYPFLQNVIHSLFKEKKAPETLNQYTFVFPSRRAGSIFKKYLQQHFENQYFWSPKVYTITEFLEQQTNLHLASNLDLTLELFNLYKNEEPTVQFEQFYSWGQLLLKDFGEIDGYMVNADLLFKNLKDLKQIDEMFAPEANEHLKVLRQFWRIFEKENTNKIEQEFVRLWEVMGRVFVAFKKVLKEKKLAYEGFLERTFAETLQENESIINELFNNDLQIVFAGFSTLNTAEKKIITTLADLNKARIFWDCDRYYLTNANQEAGFFLREYYQNYQNHPNHVFIDTDFLADKNKNIQIIGVPLSVGQAKYVGELLHQKTNKPQNKWITEKTAVVLGDENLLFPLLYAVPQNIKNVNITMGYPLKDNPLYQVLENIIFLHKTKTIPKTVETAEDYDLENTNNNETGKNTEAFYAKTVLELLNNPFLPIIDTTAQIQNLNNYILKYNVIYIYKNTIFEKLNIQAQENSIWKQIFETWDSTNFETIKNCFSAILQKIIDHFNNLKSTEETEAATQQNTDKNAKLKYSLELAFANSMQKHINQVYQIIDKYYHTNPLDANPATLNSLEVFWKLFKEITRAVKMVFEGEPIAGLQVMGFLETRALDFDNIILISTNEDKIPTTKLPQTFIPYSLRYSFKLPIFKEQDATYAYLFYRLLQRSQNVYLLYDTEAKQSGTASEKSRFIQQIEYEIQTQNNQLNIHKKLLTTPLHIHTPNQPIQIEKNEAIITVLKQYISGNKYLSPSAISTYINCPIQFYLKYVAQIPEPQLLIEDFDAAAFGNILHKIIETLYKPYINKNITKENIEKILKDEKYLKKVEIETLNELKFAHAVEGRNWLMKKVIFKLVQEILKNDIKDLPLKIIDLESKGYTHKIAIDTPAYLQSPATVNLQGTIDRIDQKTDLTNNETFTRILDYKTGKIDLGLFPKKEKINDSQLMDNYFKSLFENPDFKAAMQAFFYVYLYKKTNIETGLPKAGFYQIKTISKEGIKYLADGNVITTQMLQLYEDNLKNVLNELFSTKPFIQNKNADRYEYSPYKNLLQL